MNSNLEREIFGLISLKQEGGYWDFKEKWHTNKARLLLDIICLANNVENTDGYLIFGVTDQGEICGVGNDENRKNQENIITFLRNKKFVGGVRPKVSLHILRADEHEVDVLRVANTVHTPYYLVENFRDQDSCVRANYIYTRILDTNTPIDKSADILHVEYLWKKRFGLTSIPIDRLYYGLLDCSAWSKNSQGWYFVESPEFTLAFMGNDERTNNVKQFYSYYQTNEDTSYDVLQCKYFGTVIHETECVVLDSGRYVTSVPHWGHIRKGVCSRDMLYYKYFLMDDINYRLHEFLFDKESYDARTAHRKFLEIVLCYSSDFEKEQFEYYIKQRIDQVLEQIEVAAEKNLVFAGVNDFERKQENYRIHTGLVLNHLLEKFRKKQGAESFSKYC